MNPTNIRAKIMLTEHRRSTWNGKHYSHQFIFHAQYDDSIPEDQRFATATPSARMTLTVDNPAVIEQWAGMVGRQFYLDFTPTEASDAS